MSASVSRETGPDRFEVSADGVVAGFAQFVDHDGRRVFFHTEVGEEFGGRGLASTLVAAALEATRADGMRIVPVCPYVKKYLGTHHEVDDLVDPVTPDALAAVPKG